MCLAEKALPWAAHGKVSLADSDLGRVTAEKMSELILCFGKSSMGENNLMLAHTASAPPIVPF